jgi:hypothetical protein
MMLSMITNWHSLLNDLPDISGILLAALGVSIVFVPETIKALEAKPRIRWVIATFLFAVGLAGMVSSHMQRRESEVAQERATKEIEDAEKAATNANVEATKANESVTAAQREIEIARAEARQAEDALTELINKRSKETTSALVKLNATTEASVKGIPHPRRIPEDMKAAIVAQLSANKGIITINFVGGDAESMQFAQDWEGILTRSGWKIEQGNAVFSGNPIRGVQVTVKGDPIGSDQSFVILGSHPAAALGRTLVSITPYVTGQRRSDLPENAVVMDVGVLPRPD